MTIFISDDTIKWLEGQTLDGVSTKNLPPVASRGRFYSRDSYLSRLVHWIDENLSESG